MTSDDRRFIEVQFQATNHKIDRLETQVKENRLETSEALKQCNSRVDTLTAWFVGGLGTAVASLFAAVKH